MRLSDDTILGNMDCCGEFVPDRKTSPARRIEGITTIVPRVCHVTQLV
jgi:hypothetical protein